MPSEPPPESGMLKFFLAVDRCQTRFEGLVNQAALGGHECLRFLHEAHRYEMDSRTLVLAAENGHMDSMKYALEHGCQWTESVITNMLSFGRDNVECFKYAYEAGCPLPERVTELSARRACFGILKYLFSIGFERSLVVSLAAAGHESAQTLRFVYSQGCPVDMQVMCRAASTGGEDSLRYLHYDVGLAWDATVSAVGAAGGHTFTAKYLASRAAADQTDWPCLLYLLIAAPHLAGPAFSKLAIEEDSMVHLQTAQDADCPLVCATPRWSTTARPAYACSTSTAYAPGRTAAVHWLCSTIFLC